MPTSSVAHSRSIGSRNSFDGVCRPEKTTVKWKPTFAARISRYYQAPFATTSKFLTMRWDNRAYLKHRMAIDEAKSSVDQGPPSSFAHLTLDLRRLRREEVRLTDIERDNRILLQKMSYAYRSPPALDNSVDPRLMIIKQMGKVRMEREIVRITAENIMILEYIMAIKPEYSVKKWLAQWQLDKKSMMMNQRFPYTWDHHDKLVFPKPERPDKRYLQTILTPLKKRRDRVRVFTGDLPCDVHGNPFPPNHRRLMTSIKLTDDIVRMHQITISETNEKHQMLPIPETTERTGSHVGSDENSKIEEVAPAPRNASATPKPKKVEPAPERGEKWRHDF